MGSIRNIKYMVLFLAFKTGLTQRPYPHPNPGFFTEAKIPSMTFNNESAVMTMYKMMK